MLARARGRLSTLPLRVRLTAVFAVVIGVVLALTGVLVYVQFRQSLDAGIDEELVDRQATVVALAVDVAGPQRILDRVGEPLAQIYAGDGRVVASTRRLAGSRLISGSQVAAARRAPFAVTRSDITALDDDARVRAFALPGRRVAAIAEDLADRERALHRLAVILAITLPGALIVASFAGHRVGSSALRPVERMRARAEEIGAGDLAERLPEPGTRDELDRLAVTLNDLLVRLGQAVEHERRIVSDASHELRTPISVLRTRLDVALRQDHDLETLRGVLVDAHGDARRLSRLADDLLLLARADQGRLPLRREPLDISDLLEGAAARHHDAAGRTARTLVVSNDTDDGAVVLADPDRTAQVLDNLIVNSLRHGAGDVELRATRRGEAIDISVRDHGSGYPDAFLARAFERFSQADPASAGTGLGLTIAQAITYSQGGRMVAANHPTGGALTSFTLPISPSGGDSRRRGRS